MGLLDLMDLSVLDSTRAFDAPGRQSSQICACTGLDTGFENRYPHLYLTTRKLANCLHPSFRLSVVR